MYFCLMNKREFELNLSERSVVLSVSDLLYVPPRSIALSFAVKGMQLRAVSDHTRSKSCWSATNMAKQTLECPYRLR